MPWKLLSSFILIGLITSCSVEQDRPKSSNIRDEPQFTIIENGVIIQNPHSFDTILRSDDSIPTAIVISTVYGAYMDELQLSDRILAVGKAKQFNNLNIVQAIRDKNLPEVGEGPAIDLEKIISLKPSYVITYWSQENALLKSQLAKAGIQLIECTEFLETTPLKRATWIRVFGILFDRQEMAMESLNKTRATYLSLKKDFQTIGNRPTVFTGLIYGDNWFVAGGNSLIAQMIEDAGGDYVWKDNQESGGVALDYESVLLKAGSSNVWINAGQFMSRDELLATDHRYEAFEAFHTGKIFNPSAQMNDFGGNEYFESGIVHPERVLQDLHRIFYPTENTDSLFYYLRLR